MSTDIAATVRLGDLFNPIAGVIPSGVVASDVIANSALSYPSTANYRWDDANLKFNIQAQRWRPDVRPSFFGPQTYGGVKNVGTPRTFTIQALGLVNNFYSHITEFEFIFTGTKLSIAFYNLGGDGGSDKGGDCQVYIEWGGHMWKAKENPLTTTRTSGDASYRNITFNQPFHGRIRVHIAKGGFLLVRTDQSSIVSPSPPRYFAIADGDSYFESTEALAVDSTTGWFSSGVVDFLFEKTGFSFARRGQGATGFFCNGVGKVFDDTIGSQSNGVMSVTGVSRFLSASRRQWMTDSASMGTFTKHAGEDFGQPLGRRPLFYLLNGTWNDASVGGVTQSEMYARAKECYQWVQSVDPYCSFFHVSPEPFDDTLFGGGSLIGPPRDGDISDIHRRGQIQAAAEVARTHYVNGFGPDNPWWTGYGPSLNGTQGAPTDSQQAQLVSKNDSIHATKHGNEFYAAKIAEVIADIRIPRARAEGIA